MMNSGSIRLTYILHYKCQPSTSRAFGVLRDFILFPSFKSVALQHLVVNLVFPTWS